jgi:hypothetical protein
VPTISISSQFPATASHIADAQAAGKPSILTIDRAGAQARRVQALAGHAKVPVVADLAAFLTVLDHTVGHLLSDSLIVYSLDRQNRLTVYDVLPGSTQIVIAIPETVQYGTFYLFALYGVVRGIAKLYKEVGEGRRENQEASLIAEERRQLAEESSLRAQVTREGQATPHSAQYKRQRSAIRRAFIDNLPENTLSSRQLTQLVTATLEALQ